MLQYGFYLICLAKRAIDFIHQLVNGKKDCKKFEVLKWSKRLEVCAWLIQKFRFGHEVVNMKAKRFSYDGINFGS